MNSDHLTEDSGTAESRGTARMDPAVKAQWVAALRSGKFKQATGQLRHDKSSFCCLGVLCHLMNPRAWRNDDWGRPFYEGMEDVPPPIVAAWAGFPDMDDQWLKAQVTIDGGTSALAHHNDFGRTFAEIADAIEAQI